VYVCVCWGLTEKQFAHFLWKNPNWIDSRIGTKRSRPLINLVSFSSQLLHGRCIRNESNKCLNKVCSLSQIVFIHCFFLYSIALLMWYGDYEPVNELNHVNSFRKSSQLLHVIVFFFFWFKVLTYTSKSNNAREKSCKWYKYISPRCAIGLGFIFQRAVKNKREIENEKKII